MPEPRGGDGNISLQKIRTIRPYHHRRQRPEEPGGRLPSALSLSLGTNPLEEFHPLALGEKSMTAIALLPQKRHVRSPGGCNRSLPNRMSFLGSTGGGGVSTKSSASGHCSRSGRLRGTASNMGIRPGRGGSRRWKVNVRIRGLSVHHGEDAMVNTK